MFAFVLQISVENSVLYVYHGTEGHERALVFEFNEIKIEFVTSWVLYSDRGFDLSWRGKCNMKFTNAPLLNYLFLI